MGLVALWKVDSSQTRGGTHVPCTSRQILNHWATREALEYTEALFKKDLQNPDNHNGMITCLELGILECEVKRALESIIVNKASEGNEFQLSYFKS